MFSKRTDWTLAPNKMTLILDRFKDQEIPYIDLTVSNPTSCQFSYPQELLKSLEYAENLQYRPIPSGLLVAREAVAEYYSRRGYTIDPQEVFLTSSTSEAYGFLFRLLINSHESALFPKPSYPLFEFLTNLNDVDIEYYPLVYSDKWHIDLDELEQSIGADTQALIFVNPNNPTGSYVSAQEKKKINQICANRKLPIISDEVFFDYAFAGDEKQESFCGNQEVLTFTMGGLSKAMGLPQMKLSWIIVSGPEKYKKEALQRLDVIADTYLSVNTPVQNALKDWMHFEQMIQKDIKNRVGKNRNLLAEMTAHRSGIECLSAAGGWYAVLRIGDDIDEETFTEDLLENERILVHPGYFYDFEEGSHAVLSLLSPEGVFKEGVEKLIRNISELK